MKRAGFSKKSMIGSIVNYLPASLRVNGCSMPQRLCIPFKLCPDMMPVWHEYTSTPTSRPSGLGWLEDVLVEVMCVEVGKELWGMFESVNDIFLIFISLIPMRFLTASETSLRP